MPDLRPPVDLESVLVAVLEQDAGFAPEVGGVGDAARISTKLPSTFAPSKTLKLERAGGGVVGWPDHIDRALVTFHAYGATDVEAWTVAAALIVALGRLEGNAVAGGVVTAVSRVLGPVWSPDPDANGAPRYLLQYALTAHPAAG